MPRNAPPDNFDYRAAAEVLGLDADWYEDEDQMRQDIAARWAQAAPSQRASFSSRVNSRRSPRSTAGVNMYDPFVMGGFNMAQAMTGQQGGHLAGMANQVMGAIDAENDRRVNISRDMRRMEHDQYLANLQAELAREKLANDRFIAQNNAAQEIRKLKAAMSMQGNQSGPQVWQRDQRSGMMVQTPVPSGGQMRRRELREDPLTGETRWMEDWEM